MKDLIQRLERATGPDRELDALIAAEVHGRPEGWITHPHKYETPYTASLDAKLPWENIESVGLHDVVEGEPLGTIWEAWHRCEDGRTVMGASYHSEAIARRIAALKEKA